MSEMRDFLERLAAAGSEEERQWLGIQQLLNNLPEALRQMAWAAAVPHWFNPGILAALRPELAEKAEELYAQLQNLPVVEPFEGRGHNVHELTRAAMLEYLWREERDAYIRLSERAAAYFGSFPEDDVRAKVEFIYHLLIAEPERGADAVRDWGARWHDQWDYTWSALYALVRNVREHAARGRAGERAAGWGLYWDGLLAYYRYRHDEAAALFQKILSGNPSEERLKANCIQSLGDVHVRLSELAEARARYAEALPIYRAIGDKLGEANCIKSLGDIFLEMEEFDAAETHYRQAIEIARTISPADEAGALSSLAGLYEKQKDYGQAIAVYTRALAIFPRHTYILRNRAMAHLKRKDVSRARQDVEQAALQQPEHPYLFLRRGQLAILEEKFDDAIRYFREALKRYPRLSDAWFGIGMAHLHQENAEAALTAYREGLNAATSPQDLEDALEDLQTLREEQPDLPGVETALSLLQRPW